MKTSTHTKHKQQNIHTSCNIRTAYIYKDIAREKATESKREKEIRVGESERGKREKEGQRN